METYIYILKLVPEYRGGDKMTQEAQSIIGGHFNYLKALSEKEQIVLVGRTQISIDREENTGIAIFKANNIEEATSIMQNDPAVKNGVMTANVYPFGIALQG